MALYIMCGSLYTVWLAYITYVSLYILYGSLYITYGSLYILYGPFLSDLSRLAPSYYRGAPLNPLH